MSLPTMFQVNKQGNKQDEPWMKPILNQFNNMNFSVSVQLFGYICKWIPDSPFLPMC